VKYEELSEEAKDRAIEELGDINVDCDWWIPTAEFVRDEWLEKYGIDFEVDGLCFDLSYRRQLYFGKGKIWVEDPRRLLSALPGGAAILLELELDNNDEFPFDFSFYTHHYGGGDAETVLRLTDLRDAEAPELPFDEEEWFADLCRDFWRELEKEWEYLTSREAIEETIMANELQFSEDGELIQERR